jgi:hypothetical protein
VASHPDLRTGTVAYAIATLATSRPVLDSRPMILRLTPKTAALVGETLMEAHTTSA